MNVLNLNIFWQFIAELTSLYCKKVFHASERFYNVNSDDNESKRLNPHMSELKVYHSECLVWSFM